VAFAAKPIRVMFATGTGVGGGGENQALCASEEVLQAGPQEGGSLSRGQWLQGGEAQVVVLQAAGGARSEQGSCRRVLGSCR